MTSPAALVSSTPYAPVATTFEIEPPSVTEPDWTTVLPLLICSVTFEPCGAPTKSLTTVILPVSRLIVLFVVTSTVAPLTEIVTVAEGENVGVPNVYPSEARAGSARSPCTACPSGSH